MRLASLITRKTVHILGMNSGTSADGVDFALVKISPGRSDSGREIQARELLTGYSRYTGELRELALRLADSERVSLNEIALADEALGEFTARKARSFIARCMRRGLQVDCVASHGQTVRHHPETANIAGINVKATLQLGSPERIASKTGLVCISHFRQADIAIGGEGAPITTGAVAAVTRHPTKSRLILNLGGIANYFYIPAIDSTIPVRAEDVGPANVLLDQAARRLFGVPFDKNGARAGSGTVSERLCDIIGSVFSLYAAHARTVSTGREQYGPEVVGAIINEGKKLNLSSADILATISQLTARNIAQGLRPVLKADENLDEVYITGGGLRNRDLTGRLRLELDVSQVSSIKMLGYSPDNFEALCFATLGYFCLKGKSAGEALQTPRSGPYPIPGRICQPPERQTAP